MFFRLTYGSRSAFLFCEVACLRGVGEPTYIGQCAKLYWSKRWAILVVSQSNIALHADQYSSLQRRGNFTAERNWQGDYLSRKRRRGEPWTWANSSGEEEDDLRGEIAFFALWFGVYKKFITFAMKEGTPLRIYCLPPFTKKTRRL